MVETVKERMENARDYLHTECLLPLTPQHRTEFLEETKEDIPTLAEVLRNLFGCCRMF